MASMIPRTKNLLYRFIFVPLPGIFSPILRTTGYKFYPPVVMFVFVACLAYLQQIPFLFLMCSLFEAFQWGSAKERKTNTISLDNHLPLFHFRENIFTTFHYLLKSKTFPEKTAQQNRVAFQESSLYLSKIG